MSMSDQEFTELLRSAGALKDGHFLLASGRHSDQYVEKFDLLRNPSATERACREIVGAIGDRAIDVVAGPTTGGILLAFEVARQLGVQTAYAERKADGSAGREFRRFKFRACSCGDSSHSGSRFGWSLASSDEG